MTDMAIAGDTPEFVERLLEPAAYPHATGPIRLVETHISWVFLTGSFVYKVKKPLDLGFLDFTTLERRRDCCHEEVRVSGRFAPALYLGAVPITGTPATPRVDGAGEPFEWAVKLVQFDEADRLDALFAAGRIGPAECQALGTEIARVQEGLAVADAESDWGTARSVHDAAAINLGQLRTLRPDARDAVERVAGWLADRLTAATAAIEARRAAGRVRECHGDLHLANIVLHEGRMTAFDAIEFSPPLRWIDVANDVAFLAMDLESRGRPDLAAHVESTWMEAADDHAAAAVLPIYKVYRAVVRAAVATLRGAHAAGAARDEAHAETDRYLALAARLMAPRRPVLYATSGISGSGKSTLAAVLVGAVPAVRLRSDVERKRLFGMDATARAADPALLYGADTTQRVYERLGRLADTLLAAGASVVVDAAALMRWQRGIVAAVARARDVPMVWAEFDGDATTVLERVAARGAAGHDPSDASADVVRSQLATREPIGADELGEPSGGMLPRVVRIAAAEAATREAVTRLLQVGREPPSGP